MQRTTLLALVLISTSSLLGGCAKTSQSGPSGFAGPAEESPAKARPRSSPGEGGAGLGAFGGDGASLDAAPEAGEAAPSRSRGSRAEYEAQLDDEWDADGRIAEDRSRPGLGTAYGEQRHSSVESVDFRRAEPNAPDVVFAMRYDDVDGVRSAARNKRSRAFSDEAMQSHAGLSFALLDASGRVLPAAAIGSELWAVGEPNARYSLAVANDTGSAFELVASVDGLDVIDGRPADFSSRGYIVDPFSSVVIDGWRTSEDSVAAFRFSSIEESYAERTGEGRNVGVIGAAFFREAPRAWEEWRAPEDTWRRDRAEPFPGRG